MNRDLILGGIVGVAIGSMTIAIYTGENPPKPQKEQVSYEQKAADLQNKLYSSEMKNELLESSKEALRKYLDSQTAKLDACNKNSGEQIERIAELEAANTSLADQIKDYEKTLEQNNSNLSLEEKFQLEMQINDYRTKYDACNVDNSKLKNAMKELLD